MIVVANSSPLIALAKIERFHLLQRIFGRISIPQGVYEEVVVEGQGQAGATEVSEAEWIEVIEVQDRLAVEVLMDELDKGESETVVLARELGADWVLMDERPARRKLELLGIKRIGTLGILLKAKGAGLIDAVRPDMDRLQAGGFRVSKRVRRRVLQTAGED
ncbi:MAG: DUF3368 domain-containing protein [Chloroflexi bacterium]|nr:DUF3368 domain-containing protein [Chloroflexota bacterium]